MKTLNSSESVTLRAVNSIDFLKDAKTCEFYTCKVNVISSHGGGYGGYVNIANKNLTNIPVQFGIVDNFFNCSENNLISLEGAPEEIYGSFYCDRNKLTSLEGIHKIIKKIDGIIHLHFNPIKSGGIGLLLIEGIEGIRVDSDLPAFEIIEKYLGQGKAGVLRCQEELIEAGFEEYAKL